MPKRKNWWAHIATLGPIGYFAASGTVATFVTLPLVYALHSWVPQAGPYFAVMLSFLIVGLVVVQKALPCFNRQDDPSEIVLDEVVGCLITFWMIPLNPQSVMVGFVLFRVLDIIKFGLVKKAEDLAQAWGVMGDDVVAAIIANIILRLLY